MFFRNDYPKHRRFRCLRGFMTTGLSCFDPACLGNFIAVHRKIASMRLEILLFDGSNGLLNSYRDIGLEVK